MLELPIDQPPSLGLFTDLYHPNAAYVAWRQAAGTAEATGTTGTTGTTAGLER